MSTERDYLGVDPLAGTIGLQSVALLPADPRVRNSPATLADSWNCGLPGAAFTAFGNNCGRAPAAAVWRALSGEHVVPEWRYRDAHGQRRTVRCRDLLRQLLARLPVCRHEVLAVPNTCSEWGQEAVLAARAEAGRSASLLWRPVAAAIGFAAVADAGTRAELSGKSLAVIDLSGDTLAMTRLVLHRETFAGETFLVCERFLPAHSHLARRIPPLSLVLAEGIISRHLATTPAALWQLVCASGLADQWPRWPDNLPALELHVEGHGAWQTLTLVRDHWGKTCRDAVEAEVDGIWQSVQSALDAAGAVAAALAPVDTSGWLAARVRDIRELLAAAPWPAPDHLLIVSADADLALGPRLSLAQRLARLLGTLAAPVTVAGSGGWPADLIARGCATFAEQRERGAPTYFDHLQQLEILAEQDEEIVPRVLLPGGRVRGGEELVGEPVSGFYLDRRYDHVSFYLQQSGRKELRVLQQPFPVRLEERAPIRLCPFVRPGQGHARVEVHNRELFGARPVLLDWRRMMPAPHTRAELNAGISRSYPPYIPDVRASAEQWQALREQVDAYLGQPLRVDGREQSLAGVLDDRFFAIVGSVRFDANDETGLGRYNVFGSGDAQSLPVADRRVERFLARLGADFAESHREGNRLLLLRAIAWTYQGERFPQVRHYLIGRLQHYAEDMGAVELTGCAQLFRQPAEIALYVQAVLRVFESRGVEQMTNYIRNLRKLLTYRSDALATIDSPTCRRLVVWIGRVLEQENGRRNFEDTSLICILSLLFLLRRRRFERDFLPYRRSRRDCRRQVVELFPLAPTVDWICEATEGLVYDLIALMERTAALLEEHAEEVPEAERGPYLHRLQMVREIAKFIEGEGRTGGIPLSELT